MLPSRALVEESPTQLSTRHRRAVLLLLGLSALHVFTVWGYTGPFWGEHGRWLHEISRFAAGETVYRDFTWAGPPLAAWIVGGIARLAGTGLAAVSVTTSIIFIATILLYLAVLRRLAPDLVLAVALPAFLFAIAYAHRGGVPLPLGTLAPGFPLGFLALLGGAAAMLSAVDRLSLGVAASSGVLVGLAMLSRQEYWLAGPYLLLAGSAMLIRREGRPAVKLAPIIACLLTVAIGLGIAASGAGAMPVAWMLLQSVRGMVALILTPPGLERLTVDVAATAAMCLIAVTALWLCLAISDRSAVRWAGGLICVFLTAAAIHLGMSFATARDLAQNPPGPEFTVGEEMLWIGLQSGRGVLGAAMSLFDERLRSHLFPLILSPILLIVLAARWRHWTDRGLCNRTALLLGLCVVARAHRASGGPDWQNVMLELPTWTLFLRLLCGSSEAKAARAIRAALSVLILLGIYAYLTLARGPLTLAGAFGQTETPAGTVRWPASAAIAWHRANAAARLADPSGARPLFAFGATGGWNYFLARRNPVAATAGLTSGWITPDSVAALVRAARPAVILVDNRHALRPMPRMGMGRFLRWEPHAEPNVFARTERPVFARLREGCAEVDADSVQAVRVFSCPER